ncbi:Methionyl-tRNA synthetase [hydrothermal vent metagenome]|uniref:Methionine--tRNA ligase n=1 Tax=hydrothermal vent metagenome TaxID=652676 RepID=A0A3B1DIQ6_9ZZZZ
MPDTPTTPPTTEATPDDGPATKPEVSFEEFAKLDLRVAKIVTAEPHPNADRLLKLQLDDGSGTLRQICAGIREHYAPEDLIGKSIVIVANLAPRKIRGEESRGMLLAASDAPKDGDAPRAVVVMTPMSEIAPGATVS